MKRGERADTTWRFFARQVREQLKCEGYKLQTLEAFEEALRKFTRLIARSAFNHQRVMLSDFGVFEVKWSKGRKIRNPHTHEMMKLRPRWALKFRCSKKLRGFGTDAAPKL